MLLEAYRQGLFPMGMDDGDVGWFSPNPRALIPLDERFHIPRGLRRRLRKNPFTCTVNRNFRQVIRACATVHGETWISPEILHAYTALHRAGHAHSVEVWQGEDLAGGLYGVSLGGAFFGESMFHTVTDASKVGLVYLVERLRERGFQILDTQWTTPHLTQFGTFTVSREAYLKKLRKVVAMPCRFA